MTWIWNGLRIPMLAFARLWRCKRGRRTPILDAHWRRDLGFDN